MVRPNKEIEDLLLSKTKNFETLVRQTHRKPKETLEFKFDISRETFQFKPPISIESYWMIGLLSLEVYNSVFNITEENNKIQLDTDVFEESSYAELKDELDDILSTSDITPTHLQHERIGYVILKPERN